MMFENVHLPHWQVSAILSWLPRVQTLGTPPFSTCVGFLSTCESFFLTYLGLLPTICAGCLLVYVGSPWVPAPLAGLSKQTKRKWAIYFCFWSICTLNSLTNSYSYPSLTLIFVIIWYCRIRFIFSYNLSEAVQQLGFWDPSKTLH